MIHRSRARAAAGWWRAALLLVTLATTPALAAAQETHLLVVVGLGGDAEHRERFHDWAVQLIDAARSRYGVPATQVTYLGEKPESDPELIQDRSTAENIQAAVRAIAEATKPGDAVVVVLIGHGTARGAEARFNLPGPDLGPAEFGLLLDLLAERRVAFVNTASASGGFLPELAADGRVIITATRSAREQNEAVFGGFFVEAFEGDEADLDKDGRVSLLEAFQYAASETQRHYDDQGLLLTEHAILEDDGDGVGEQNPSPPDTDGRLAAALFLAPAAPPSARGVAVTPELQALYDRRDSLQARVQELRGVQETLDAAEYERRLEDLLVELGLTQREIRSREGGSHP